MSQVLKAQEGSSNSHDGDFVDDDDDVDFSIGEEDVRESLKTFVKGMSEQEKRRFIDIYNKYQDKGGNNTANSIKQQKQIQY